MDTWFLLGEMIAGIVPFVFAWFIQYDVGSCI